MNIWVKLGAFWMFLAVGLGAFGTHGLKWKLDAGMMDVYKTAVFYHMIHSLALFLVGWIASDYPNSKIFISGYLFIAGIILFSGSLYLLSTLHLPWLGMVTPIGGLCFMLGWLLMLF